MSDQPYPTGTVCIITFDPYPDSWVGREVMIESQDVLLGGDPSLRPCFGIFRPPANCLLQHISARWLQDTPGKDMWPIRWMVPKNIDPDAVVDETVTEGETA